MDIAKSEDVQSTSGKAIKRSNAKKKQFVLLKQKTKQPDACMGRAWKSLQNKAQELFKFGYTAKIVDFEGEHTTR